MEEQISFDELQEEKLISVGDTITVLFSCPFVSEDTFTITDDYACSSLATAVLGKRLGDSIEYHTSINRKTFKGIIIRVNDAYYEPETKVRVLRK